MTIKGGGRITIDGDKAIVLSGQEHTGVTTDDLAQVILTKT